MTADEKILALIKPEYLERVPRMFCGHATKTTVKKDCSRVSRPLC